MTTRLESDSSRGFYDSDSTRTRADNDSTRTLTWKTMTPDSTRLETSLLGKLESSVRTQQAAASAEHATADHRLIDWDSLPLCSLNRCTRETLHVPHTLLLQWRLRQRLLPVHPFPKWFILLIKTSEPMENKESRNAKYATLQSKTKKAPLPTLSGTWSLCMKPSKWNLHTLATS